jgi:RluA family pseudouridine synthase
MKFPHHACVRARRRNPEIARPSRASDARSIAPMRALHGPRVPAPSPLRHRGAAASRRQLPRCNAAAPVDWATRLLYEDESLVVVDKPCGIPSTPGGGSSESALHSLELHLSARERKETRLFPVHRLDKQTSGVLVLAKSAHVAFLAGQLFASRDVKKTYWALLNGPPLEADTGEWRDLLSSTTSRSRVVDAGGKSAVTGYRVLQRTASGCIVELTPRTGRMHQLRVQAASRGRPVAGDDVYGRADGAKSAAPPPPPRLCLHCSVMSMEHPEKPGGMPLVFEAALPEELRRYVACI